MKVLEKQVAKNTTTSQDTHLMAQVSWQ